VPDGILGITKENPHTLESWNLFVHPEHQKEIPDCFFTHVVKGKKKFF